MAEFTQTRLNTVNRRKQRGVYDHATVHKLVDETPVLHVAFNPAEQIDPTADNFPVILPMLGCTGAWPVGKDAPTSIYLHGYVSARLMKLPRGEGADGVPVSVSATALDGIVLALSAFNHSCNYRSAVVFGHAKIVTDPDEKMYAMERVVDTLIPHRWANIRGPPTDAEMKSTGILRVDIDSASAKVHVGGPSDDRADAADPAVTGAVWTGVVPTWTQYGPLLEGAANQVAAPPAYLRQWVSREGDERRRRAFDALADEHGVRGVK